MSAEDRPAPRHALLLTICCLAQFMVILDVSIVNVALPSIKASLGFSTTDLQWVVNAYTITFAGFLMLSGRAADLLGHRRTLVTGLLVFALASLIGGAAQTQEMLIGARALQGLGGAIMAAASLAVITSSFAPGPERHRAIGLWGAMNGAGGATGTLLGGIITEELSWRWILLINLPIGIAAAFVASAVIAERKRDSGAHSFDLGGALSITGGMLALVYGIVSAGNDGWGALDALGPIVLGALLLVAFAVIEGRVALAPLVPLRVFKVRPVRIANIVVLLFSAALFPMWYLTSLYMQDVLRMPPLGAGLAFLPMALTIMACAMRAGPLTARYGVRTVLGFGLTTMALGLALFFALVNVDGSYATSVLFPGLLVSVGVGFSVVPSTIAATAGAQPSEAGLASGLVNTSRQMGGALGLAILASLGAQYTSHLIGSDYQSPLLALTNGFRLGYLLGAVFVGVAAIVVFTLIPKAPAAPSTPAAPAAPSTPAAPAAPSTPAVPEAPSTPAAPAAPSTPAVPEAFSTPAAPEAPSTPAAPAAFSTPAASPEPEQAGSVPPAQPAPTAGADATLDAPARADAASVPPAAPIAPAPTNGKAQMPPIPASLPTAKPPAIAARDPLHRPAVTVVLSLADGGRWPLAAGTMTIRVADVRRAGRAA
jgi:EmrB/QacA subfamily drug resistance transporter